MPPPTAPTLQRTILWVPKFDLSIHSAVAQTPEDRTLVDLLVSEWQDKLVRGVPAERLIHDPLQINADKEVEDGRHRLLAALRIDAIHSLPCEITENSDPEALVCEKLLQRRHYSKSARAYALRHMAARAAQEGAAGRMAGAHAARGIDVSRSNRLTSDPKVGTLASLAAKSNLSVDLLQQAVKLEAFYMVKADALIADWLKLNPDYADLWQEFQDGNPTIEMPWSCWRSQRLAHHGFPDDAKSIHVIPKHWREIEEDKIFNGVVEADGEDDDRRSYSLGSALKALGSYFATAGQPRADVDEGNGALYLTLQNKVISFSRTMWAKWQTIEPAGRMEVMKELTAKVVDWPEDVRRSLVVALSKEAAK
jgi:hypothetical protein